MGEEVIMRNKEEKDLRVIVQDILTPERHINLLFAPTYRTLTNTRMSFNYMGKRMMKKIIRIMIRPKLEYAAWLWSPIMLKDIRKI